MNKVISSETKLRCRQGHMGVHFSAGQACDTSDKERFAFDPCELAPRLGVGMDVAVLRNIYITRFLHECLQISKK